MLLRTEQKNGKIEEFDARAKFAECQLLRRSEFTTLQAESCQGFLSWDDLIGQR